MARIDSLADLEALYGTPGPAALRKVATTITPAYRRLIEAAPFLALATSGPEGLDVSPRGDAGGRLVRIDSLRNVVRDPRVALMFLIPGWGNALRVNGRAHVEADAALIASFAVDGKAPRSVLAIGVDEIFFQCARAVVRAGLWTGAAAPAGLPTAGEILAGMTEGEVGGGDYDSGWAARAAATLWCATVNR